MVCMATCACLGVRDAESLGTVTRFTCVLCKCAGAWSCPRFFYASSACIYPEFRQLNTEVEGGGLKESDAWPAQVCDFLILRLLVAEIAALCGCCSLHGGRCAAR